jgi:nicotinate-nucleotide--dimethylbenzimidazole phosphoribosyltransferase
MTQWTNIAPRSNPSLRDAVAARWNSLTKPPGSLGRLESLITDVAEIQGSPSPRTANAAIFVFCGDHGAVASGVSAWPSEVTAQMVNNFLHGGAAISVLGRTLDLALHIVDCGVLGPVNPGAIDCKIRPGTRDFTKQPAMTSAEATHAIENGITLARASTADIVGAGEMGIGNSSSASALACALLGLTAEESVGAGAGSSGERLQSKRLAVEQALHLHRHCFSDPLATLAALGGYEIATMSGFMLGCAMDRRPVVVDGFISTAAALVARRLSPAAADYFLYSHCSAEKAHRRMLTDLQAEPMLDLGLRLGEGTGAALAIGLLRNSHALYSSMATFEEAAVAGEAHS